MKFQYGFGKTRPLWWIFSEFLLWKKFFWCRFRLEDGFSHKQNVRYSWNKKSDRETNRGKDRRRKKHRDRDRKKQKETKSERERERESDPPPHYWKLFFLFFFTQEIFLKPKTNNLQHLFLYWKDSFILNIWCVSHQHTVQYSLDHYWRNQHLLKRHYHYTTLPIFSHRHSPSTAGTIYTTFENGTLQCAPAVIGTDCDSQAVGLSQKISNTTFNFLIDCTNLLDPQLLLDPMQNIIYKLGNFQINHNTVPMYKKVQSN